MSYPFETSRQPSQTDQPLIPVDAVEVSGDRVFTTSLMVAKVFGKRHAHVLRDIDNLDCSPEFHQPNFGLMFRDVQIGNGATRQERYFEMTKDGFTILVMGYSGKKAMQFKEAYIGRFNEMEARLLGSFRSAQGELFDVPPDLGAVARVFGQGIRLAKLGGLDVDQARRIADRETFKRLGVSPLAILNVDAPANQPSYTVTEPPEGPAMLTASALLQRHGSNWSAIAFNRAMAHVGYLEYRSVERLNKPAMRYSVLIEEGLGYGENVKYNDRYPTTSPLYYPDRFPALLEIIEPVMEEQMRSEVEALDGDTSQMTRKQRQLYKDSGLKAQRKAEKIEQRIERLFTMADEGETWKSASRTLSLPRYFDADERYQLRVQFAERQGKPKPVRIVQDPGRALPASLQPVDREAANNPDWLEPKDPIDPAVRADYKARNQYQPVSREQAREFLIEEAQKFLAVGDDWETFCYMRGRIFPMAFNDAEILSLRQAYERAFPTGDPLNWSGAV